MNGSAFNNWSILKDKPFVTPEMFGAVGDGVADDSSAIQAATDTGLTVIFEPKIYRCAEVTTNKSVTWIGNNDTVIQTISVSSETNQFRNVLTVTGDSEDLEKIHVEISGIHFKGLGEALKASTTTAPFPTLLKFSSCNIYIHDSKFSSLYTKNTNTSSTPYEDRFAIFYVCLNCTNVRITNNEIYDSGKEELTSVNRSSDKYETLKSTYEFTNNDIHDIYGYSFNSDAEIIYFCNNKIERFDNYNVSITNFNCKELYANFNYVSDSKYTQFIDGSESGSQRVMYAEITGNYVNCAWGDIFVRLQSKRVILKDNFHVGNQLIQLTYYNNVIGPYPDLTTDFVPESVIIENNYHKYMHDEENTKSVEYQAIMVMSNHAENVPRLQNLEILSNYFDLIEADNKRITRIVPMVIYNVENTKIDNNIIYGKPIESQLSSSNAMIMRYQTNVNRMICTNNVIQSEYATNQNTYLAYLGTSSFEYIKCLNNKILNNNTYSELYLNGTNGNISYSVNTYHIDFQLAYNDHVMLPAEGCLVYNTSENTRIPNLKTFIECIQWRSNDLKVTISIGKLDSFSSLPSTNLGVVEVSKQDDNLFLTFRDTQSDVYTCTYVNGTWSSWKQVSLV